MDQSVAKNLQALQSLLGYSGPSADVWLQRDNKVLVAVDERLLNQADGQSTLAMAVNLLSRMAPVVRQLDVIIPGDVELVARIPLTSSTSLREAIKQLLSGIGPALGWNFVDRCQVNYDAVLSIGNISFDHIAKVSIASDGWLVYLSPGRARVPVFTTTKSNAIGAYAAACLGAAEVFKILLMRSLPHENVQHVQRIDEPMCFSTFNYQCDEKNPFNPLLPRLLTMADSTIAGVGAGGGSLVYTLASLSTVAGRIALVDPDEVRESNLNRYIFALRDHVLKRVPKVNLGASLLRIHPDLDILPLQGAYSKQKTRLKQEAFLDTVVSTVDSGEERKSIQWDLPRVILDASATRRGEYMLLRVDFSRGYCLVCKHPPGEGNLKEEKALAEITGISVEEILAMKQVNDPFQERHRQILLAHLSPDQHYLVPEVGVRWSDWQLKHCGKLDLDFSSQRDVPIPFATVLPGVLLAGELIKQTHFPDHRLNNLYLHNVMREPTSKYPTFRKPRSTCELCQDPDAQEIFRNRYQNAAENVFLVPQSGGIDRRH